MARSFVTTDIVDPVKAPFSKRSLDHLNSALDELTKQTIESTFSIAYTTNDIIILDGCYITATIPGTSSVTAGRIYYNGKIYQVDANASISTPANTLVWSIATTYISGDPATFSDGNNYNFHKIEKFQLTNAVSGSGLADYNGTTVKYKIKKYITELGNWDMDATSSVIASISLLTGFQPDKIKSIDISILLDSGGFKPNFDSSGVLGVWCEDSSSAFPVYTFTITRLTGGKFDNTNFNDGTINRGFLVVESGDI